MPFNVYILLKPGTKTVVYVGCTCRHALRMANHKCNFKKQYGYEPDNKVVATFDNQKEALQLEQSLIVRFSGIMPLVNKGTGKGHCMQTDQRKSRSEKLRDSLIDQFNDFINEDSF